MLIPVFIFILVSLNIFSLALSSYRYKKLKFGIECFRDSMDTRRVLNNGSFKDILDSISNKQAETAGMIRISIESIKRSIAESENQTQASAATVIKEMLIAIEKMQASGEGWVEILGDDANAKHSKIIERTKITEHNVLKEIREMRSEWNMEDLKTNILQRSHGNSQNWSKWQKAFGGKGEKDDD